MTDRDKAFCDSLKAMADQIKSDFNSFVDAQPEDQLKRPVQDFLEAAGASFRHTITTKTEARAAEIHGRPDIGVANRKLLCGYIELKAPGKGARPEKFKGREKDQWNKFKSIPNLIYTDGTEWTLFRTGIRTGTTIRFSGDLHEDGSAAISDAQVEQLRAMLRDFFSWEPIVPDTPTGLAQLIAPICRLLRDEVSDAVARKGSNLNQIYSDWKDILFPDADEAQFADAYAQTFTYAFLIARFEGGSDLDIHSASQKIEHSHGLLAQTLKILGDTQAREEISLGIDLLERCIRAASHETIARKSKSDPWLYFYEDFLAAYDPKLRSERGVYYTPVEVVRTQVKLVSELLRKKFKKKMSFADDGVVFLDPAVGTGAYPIAAIKEGLDCVEAGWGAGAVKGRASVIADNMHAFEILVGPYAVAHLRISQAIRSAGGELPDDGVHVFLNDALESPFMEPPGQQALGFFYKKLTEEHKKAQQLKARKRVFVCMGNPPYDRQQAENPGQEINRKGGWVRNGDQGNDGILNHFIEPLERDNDTLHAKNLYNDYVYFWRWALWKVFENTKDAGIVSFITASSYLRGPGFKGMREFMRRTLDELWIIDLEGDSRGARKSQNVFAIQTPVCIAVGVRYGKPATNKPANVWYTRLTGSRQDKLKCLDEVSVFTDIDWQECYQGLTDIFSPVGGGDFFSWPLMIDLFPWQHSGVQFKRKWPIGETRDLLEKRWDALISNDVSKRAELFRETDARLIINEFSAMDGMGKRLPAIATYDTNAAVPDMARYGYRSFDRQWVFADQRFCDRPRPPLWLCFSEKQIYLTSLLTEILGDGSAATITPYIPDLHHYRGSFGGKHIIPLWRDAAATEPNTTKGLLEAVGAGLQAEVAPENFMAYCYAVLGSPSYSERFRDELSEPGPRIPITKDAGLFEAGVALGKKLIHLHTFGERCAAGRRARGDVPKGNAKCIKGISSSAASYPEAFEYDEGLQTVYIGDGAFAPVALEVWNFCVSGFEVVKSWLGYRMKKSAGKSSSPLDEIRPESWTADLTEEFLRVLWILEHTIALFPELSDFLNRVCASDVFTKEELPMPDDEQRQAPKAPKQKGPQEEFSF